MAEGKHTPGKLRYDPACEDLRVGAFFVASIPATVVQHKEMQRANARRLVQCWNAHDDLVAAGKELLEAFDNAERSAHERACYLQLAVASIRDAIAKATGEQP